MRKPCDHPGCWRTTYAHHALCYVCWKGECDTYLCPIEGPPDDGSSIGSGSEPRRGMSPIDTLDGR